MSPLSKQLGAARSSFYWHFRDREELVTAALGEWERRLTDETIAAVLGEADPRERLRKLFALAFADPTAPVVEVALAARTDDPLVGPIVARVTAKRVAFMTRCFEELGFGDEARARAVIAYATFVGWLQLRQTAPEVVALAPDDGASLATVVEQLFVPPELTA